MTATTIILDSITFAYDGALEPIFENLSLSIDMDWRLGIIGRNGRGKTTLLNLLAQNLKPQSGSMSLPDRVSMFPVTVAAPVRIEGEIREKAREKTREKAREKTAEQITEKNAEKVAILTTLDTAKNLVGPVLEIEREMNALMGRTDENSLNRYGELAEEYEYLRGYSLDALIEKEFRLLNLNPEILERPYSTLSGGEKTKVQIASLFLRPDGYLLIDEPTNHLDIEGRAELSDYLSTKKGFCLVSHDQAFIDECCDHILEIGKNSVHLERGNYSSWDDNRRQFEAFELAKKEKLEKETQQLEKAAKQARGYSFSKEKEKIGAMDKGFVGARSARLMKRAKNLEKQRTRKLDEARALLKTYEKVRHLEFKQMPLGTESYLTLQEVNFSFGKTPILENFHMEIKKGDRIWIRGGNGSGKSTLLRLLTGELEADSGYIRRAIDLKISQAFQDMPVRTGSVERYLDQCGTDTTAFVRMLDYFGMNVSYLERSIESLSEGERKKLDLARAFSSDAPLYIWDEPLNYMDYHFRIQLEEAVLKYKPTVIFVEHDRSFGESVATKIIDI